MLEELVQWWLQYQHFAWAIGIASVMMLVAGAIAVPWLVVILPADFFSERGDRRRLFEPWPLLRALFLLIKNLLGTTLFLLGVLMLFLPGPGILTMMVALALINFPGKRKLELRLLHRPAVLTAINRIRIRAGREPLSF